METSKFWSVSLGLRGFYDDNYAMRPDNVARDSFGFEVMPSVKLNYAGDQTYVGLSYDYTMKYYDDRVNNSADHSHVVNARLNHAFTPGHKLDLTDSFVIAQEPELLEPSGAVTFPLRSDGNNIHNNANATYTGELTQLLSVVLGYSNGLYDYQQTGPSSYSAALDRMEHLVTFNLRWTALQSTVLLLGYQYNLVDHTSKDSLVTPPAAYINPNVRDSESHYVYGGVDQVFNQYLSASLRAGAQITEYQNALPTMDDNQVSPYVDVSGTWTYMEGSSLQVGVRHARNQTDVAFFAGGATPTIDQESTTVYASLTHKFTAKFKGNLMGQFQHGEFNGGTIDGQADDYYSLGVNFSYQFNQYFSAEAGYSYDKLDSDLAGRAFDRNRVYIGVRAVY
ncbi:MAG TPA: outer membrane beta-barrel protein [Verrucomicrobiae bacterium]|nr:outer membrane beta-barrel protein [Verrucomicrobiae bacterium]